jgi:hypothetical protein
MSIRLSAFKLAIVALLGAAPHASAQPPASSAPQPVAKRVATGAQPAAAPSLRDKLAAQVDVDLHDKSLADLPAWLRDQHGVKSVFDIKALEEAGIELGSHLNLRVRGISLRSALRHLLREHDLTSVVDGELLVITTPEEAEQYDLAEVYNVADLLVRANQPLGESQLDYDSLLDLVQTCVVPDSWFPERTFALLEETIAFPQSDEVHEQIAALLTALRAAKQRGANPANADWSPIFVEPAGSQKIRAALGRPMELAFADTPLDQVVEQVGEAYSIPVLLDGKALEEAGVPVHTPLRFEVRGLTLVQALRHLLAQIGLVPVVRDEALVITASEEAEQVDLGLRIYPVGDLITPNDDPLFEAGELTGAIRACRQDTWDRNNGPGSAVYLPASQAIVVSHLDEVQDEVAQLLGDLRKARAEQGPRPKPDDNELVLKIYRLGQIQQRSDVPAEVAAALIQEFVAPETWTKYPEVRLRTAPDRLVIRQRRAVHKQIARFLEELGVGPGRGMGGQGMF